MDINNIMNFVKKNGGLVFDTPYFLNLFAVRDASNVNKFNDTLVVYWFDDKKNVFTYMPTKGFTTDPGFKSLTSPQNKKGCAILKEGWYRKLWTKGLHQGKYSALVQANSCTVYRDNDKDKELDMNTAKTDTGIFGINMHRANEKAVSTTVENWSAGCQVWASPGEFSYFMQLVNKAISAGQKYFSYFLTNNKLFNITVNSSATTMVIDKAPMRLNTEGLNLIKKFEGCKLTAYKCPSGVWTIGYGNTYYEDGTKIKQGDKITQQRADELFKNIVEKKFAEPIRKLITSYVTDNMFNAIVSFAYNVGLGNLKNSTLLKKVNANPNDKTIADEFAKWTKSGGKVLAGLVKRRKAETDLYFKK